jgi:hypothetical protein
MMVIRDGAGRIYPADACAWGYPAVNPGGAADANTITDADARTDGYYIYQVRYYTGGDVTGTPLAGRPVGDLNGVVVNLGVCTLGQIGKSGRFVALTNPV